MLILETERTSSPHVNLTTYIQIRGESVDLRPTTLSKEFVALCGLRRMVRLYQRVGGAYTKELVRETEGLGAKYS